MLAFFLFTGCVGCAVAQSEVMHLHGIIRDRESGEPVPYASVSLSNSTRGTAADARGEFSLMLREKDFNEALKITSIGFVSVTVKVDSLRKVPSPVIIQMPSDVRLLQEVEIRQQPIQPIEVIRMGMDSVRKNYSDKPFNLEFHSVLTASSLLTSDEFVVESIIAGYYPGYADSQHKRFEILRKRARGTNLLEASDYPFWPTLEIHRADLIADPMKTGIFQEKNLDKFSFTYKGLSTYDADTVYQIDYVLPKPTQKITGYGVVPKTYRGSVYITTASHAIVKHDIETDQFSYSIIYKKLADHYYPYIIRGERRLTGVNMFSTVQNIVRLTQAELDNVRVIDYRTNEFLNLSLLPDDNDYWMIHYPEEKK